MKRRRIAILSCFLVLAFSPPVLAQADLGGDPTVEDDIPPEPAEPAPTDDALKASDADVAPTTPVLTTGKRIESKETWKDIVVVPRKPFLKKGRVDLTPFVGVTLNDNIIQHTGLGLEFAYHITDVLSVGVLGMYYFKNILDQEFYTRYHYSRVPAMNKMNYTVALNFFYVPIYGKLALFNDFILHFEVFATAGVGGTGTEIVPRDYTYELWRNPFSLTFPVGMGGRVFVNRFFAIQAGIRDFMMVDKFEPSSRGQGKSDDPNTPENEELEDAKGRASTRFINSLQFFFGLSFYLPPSFEYTTFR